MQTTAPPIGATAECPAPAEPEWSCRACGDAYFGDAPEHRHCPGCASGAQTAHPARGRR